jgi:hypothetical protein
VVREIIGAAGVVWRHRPLAWAFVSVVVVAMVWGIAFTIGAPLFAHRVLRAGIAAYGLIVGAYGVGNVASNLVLGSLVLRRRVATLFAGRIVLGTGFLLLAGTRSLPLAMLVVALAGAGGPMDGISSLLMIQTDIPAGQIGKVYSLRATLDSGGLALGLLLAPALYAALPVPLVMALCAVAAIATGVAGLLRFGLREPVSAPAAPLGEEPGGA